MPVNSVQQYVKGLFNGLASPQYAPIVATIGQGIPLPTKFADADTGGLMRPVPQAWIWAKIHEDRQTMPRARVPVMKHGAGYKKAIYQADVVVQVIEKSDDPLRETAFACLIDAINYMLNTTEMPLDLNDSVTGYPSQMLQIGEEFDTEMFIPEAVAIGSQGAVRSTVRFNLKLEEAFTFP